MYNSRFLECLDADFLRLRDVVDGHLAAQVPTCPDWTVADLTRHVGEVYLHKVEMMRQGKHPEGWPPASFKEAEPVGLLTRGYGELVAEFAARNPAEPAKTWYDPNQTVGFWIRRMAQETVIHRIDAELGAGTPVAPIPDDLAIDGIDELLNTFVAYGFSKYPEDFAEPLKNSPGRTYVINASETSWTITTSPNELKVTGGPGTAFTIPDSPDVVVSGSPSNILRWAWNRETPNTPTPVTIKGTPEALTELHQCVVAATQ
ncbi:MAG TPA: maleylpyruvate isomerase family mycothiol-dependent enzyme [Trebonia sp.]|nr:maleylpyruvate isomerase family mycothiol-dependent enzyme [Trebonia sp.]